MSKTVNFNHMIASSHRRRTELEQRIERLSYELRDEIADLTGHVYRVQLDVEDRFIFITKVVDPARGV